MATTLRQRTLDRFDSVVLRDWIEGLALDARLLAGVPFECAIDSIRLDDVVLERGCVRGALYVSGGFGADRISIGCTMAASPAGLLNSQTVPRGSVNVFCEGSAMTYRTPLDFRWSVVRMSRELLQEAAMARYGERLELPTSGVRSMQPTALSAALAGRIDAVFAAAMAGEESSREAVAELVAAYAGALREGLRTPPSPAELIRARRNGILRRIERFWQDHRTEPFDLATLCRETGRSSRVIQYTFKELFGVGPRAWFEIMKLNEARRELAAARDATATISDVALRWGFAHLGRFSRDYRRLFGEMPSQTLRLGTRATSVGT